VYRRDAVRRPNVVVVIHNPNDASYLSPHPAASPHIVIIIPQSNRFHARDGACPQHTTAPDA
jgi:hypothetical protein